MTCAGGAVQQKRLSPTPIHNLLNDLNEKLMEMEPASTRRHRGASERYICDNWGEEIIVPVDVDGLCVSRT